MPIVMKSGSFNLLVPKGPVEASNGIALPVPALAVVAVRCTENTACSMVWLLLHVRLLITLSG